jgi:hypothetical protein
MPPSALLGIAARESTARGRRLRLFNDELRALGQIDGKTFRFELRVAPRQGDAAPNLLRNVRVKAQIEKLDARTDC